MSSIREESTGRITGTIVDGATGLGVSADDLDTVTLTLYDYVTGTIINSKEDLDILNANGATISNGVGTEGNFSIPLSDIDNAIINTARQSEDHIALIKFTTPTVKGSTEIRFTVKNVKKIT